mgnify:CR=1 FL=1
MSREPPDEGVFGPTTVDSMRKAQKIATSTVAKKRALDEKDQEAIASHIVERARRGEKRVSGLVRSVLKAFLGRR